MEVEGVEIPQRIAFSLKEGVLVDRELYLALVPRWDYYWVNPRGGWEGRWVGGYIDPSTIELTNPPTLTDAMKEFIAEEDTWDEEREAPMMVDESRIRVE